MRVSFPGLIAHSKIFMRPDLFRVKSLAPLLHLNVNGHKERPRPLLKFSIASGARLAKQKYNRGFMQLLFTNTFVNTKFIKPLSSSEALVDIRCKIKGERDIREVTL